MGYGLFAGFAGIAAIISIRSLAIGLMHLPAAPDIDPVAAFLSRNFVREKAASKRWLIARR